MTEKQYKLVIERMVDMIDRNAQKATTAALVEALQERQYEAISVFPEDLIRQAFRDVPIHREPSGSRQERRREQ